MSRLPKTVKAGPYVFKVQRSHYPDGHSSWGISDMVNREILIGKQTDPVEAPITMLHEMLHVAGYIAQRDFDEETVKSVAHVLAQMLQDIGWMPRRIR
jgi:hypothetical protein